MPSTFSSLKIELIATGEQSGTWGVTTNTNLGTAIEEAITGSADVTFTNGNDTTITLTDTNAAQAARNLRLNLVGSSTGAQNLILGSGCQIEKLYLINNTLGHTITVKNTTGTGVAVPAGKKAVVYNDGTNVVNAIDYFATADIAGGTINNTVIGGTTPAAGTFTQVNVTGQGDLRLEDTTGGEYVALQAPGTLASSYTLTLPVDDGTNGQALITDGNGNLSWSTAASGDVYGPASATDNAVVRFDSTTGKIIKNSGVIIDNSNNVTGVADFTNTGNTTLGNASGDTLTITGTAVTTPNGLNFDSNTLVIDAANNRVGVGTASPASNLHISASGNSFARFTNTAGTSQFLDIGANGSNELFVLGYGAYPVFFGTNGSERMRITSAGDVGIGTSSPSNRLEVSNSRNGNTVDVVLANTYYLAGSTDELVSFQGEFYQNDVAANRAAGYMRFGKSGDFSNNANASAFLSFATRNVGTVAERLRIDSSGNVGIGTTSPAVRLDVVASAGTRQSQSAFTSLIVQRNATEDLSAGINIIGGATTGQSRIDFSDSGANAIGSIIYSHDSNYMRFDANNAERMRLDSSGNLGLGVTPSAWSSSFPAFQIGYTGALSGRSGTTEAVVLASNSYNAGGNKYIGTGFATSYEQYSGTHRWLTAPSGTAGNTITFTQAMTLNASGNLGIGTTSPSERLEVSGNLAFSTDAIIRRTTSDGSDNSYIGITGGGGLSIARGSQVVSFGNEHPTDGGKLNLLSGNVANSEIVLNAYSSSSVIRMLTNNTERMRIDSSGRLLIGATSARTDLFGTASANLQVEGASGDASRISIIRDVNTDLTNGGGIVLGASRGGTVGSNTIVTQNTKLGYLSFLGADGASMIEAASIASAVDGTPGANDMPGRIVFSTTADGAATPTERMRITSAGNVGIGNTNPITRVDNAGQYTTVIGSGGGYGFTRSGIYVATLTKNSTDDSVYLNNINGSYLAFGTNNTERMRIDSSGRLLYGTTSDSLSANGFRITSSTGQFGGITMTGGTGDGPQWQMINLTAAATVPNGFRWLSFRINSSADEIGKIEKASSTSVAFTTTSDYRLKENVEPLTNALARVAALKPVKWKWKNQSDGGEGFIAHELAEVCPLAVTGKKDAYEKDGVTPRYQGVDTSFLVATLAAAIQELKAELDAVKTELNQLKGV